MSYLILLIGFAFLVKGANFFVDGASGIAKIFKIPSLVIGLTIVSIGTSLPEAAVSISAGLQGSNDIALGNVVGSNIFNIAVVVGICALIKPITIDKQLARKEIPFMLISSIIALLLIIDGTIGLVDSIVLLVLFVLFMWYVVRYAMKNKTKSEETDSTTPLLRSILFTVFGAMLIIFGGQFVVNSAKEIALSFHISEAVIGLTVVAVGTSLPELVTSIVAARKGESEIAIGNVVGSNIFNLLFILGSTSMITPISVATNSMIDLGVFIGLGVFVYVFAKIKGKIHRVPAGILVASYVLYTAYIILR